MDNSILHSIKKLLGPSAEDTNFDVDIIMHINTAFSVLYQLGVGPTTGFSISDESKLWSDFLPDSAKLEMVKTYVYLKTRLYFDPPSTGVLIDAINRQISELEWRINAAVDPPNTFG